MMASAKWACGLRRSIVPRRLLLLSVQVLGLAVLISLLMRVLFGRSTDPSHPAAKSNELVKENLVGDAGKSPAAISAAAPPLSSQNPWRTNTSRQKGGNTIAGGDGNILDGESDTDTGEKLRQGKNDKNENDEDNEAYMPAHLSELLVKDGVPKQAPGPQSF